MVRLLGTSPQPVVAILAAGVELGCGCSRSAPCARSGQQLAYAGRAGGCGPELRGLWTGGERLAQDGGIRLDRASGWESRLRLHSRPAWPGGVLSRDQRRGGCLRRTAGGPARAVRARERYARARRARRPCATRNHLILAD